MMAGPFLLAAAIGHVVVGAGVSRAKSKKKPALTVVASLPLTGILRDIGADMLDAMQLALADYMRKNPPIAVKLIALDDGATDGTGSSMTKVQANIGRAIDDPTVVATVGPMRVDPTFGAIFDNSPTAMPVLSFLGQQALSVLSPTLYEARASLWGPQFTHVFNLLAQDDVVAEKTVTFVAQLGGKAVALAYDASMQSRRIAQDLARAALANRLSIVERIEIRRDEADLGRALAPLERRPVDWLITHISAPEREAKVMNIVRKKRLAARMMICDSLLNEALLKRPAAHDLNGRLFATFGALAPNQQHFANKRFLYQFDSRYHRQPAALAGHAYAAMQLILAASKANFDTRDAALGTQGSRGEAMLEAEARRAVISNALARQEATQTPAGPICFATSGELIHPKISGHVVENGAFAFVRQLESDLQTPSSTAKNIP